MQGAKYWLRGKRRLEQEDFPRGDFSLAPSRNRLTCRVFSGADASLSSRNGNSPAI
jgi:hypothetical protein